MPSIEREIRGDLTEKAENHAIDVFSENLRNLLLQPPLKGKQILGVDLKHLEQVANLQLLILSVHLLQKA